MAYKCSLFSENIEHYRSDVVFRTNAKVKMELEFTNKERVSKSPYYLINWLNAKSSLTPTKRGGVGVSHAEAGGRGHRKCSFNNTALFPAFKRGWGAKCFTLS